MNHSDPFNGKSELAAMSARGHLRNACEAVVAADILRIIIETDTTPEPAQRMQRAAVLKLAQKLIRKYADEQSDLAFKAYEWKKILLRENTDVANSGEHSDRDDGTASPSGEQEG